MSSELGRESGTSASIRASSDSPLDSAPGLPQTGLVISGAPPPAPLGMKDS
jgi:hypothetical protein